MQLAAFTSDHFPLGQAAMQINEGMPAYIVSALERRHGSLRGRTVGILGMAFKAESDDIRASLSFKLRKLLEWAGARVLCADPYVMDDRLSPLDEVLERQRDPRHRRAAPRLPLARPVGPRGRRHLERHRRRDPALGMKVLVTGAAGFICGYLVEELLGRRPRGRRPRQLQQVRPRGQVATTTTRATASSRATRRTSALLTELAADVDQVVAAAAMIGGISYFHEFAFDLLAENERILASTFEAAIAAHKAGRLAADRRPVELDGVRVARTVFPTPEGAERTSPPPISTYGFQKLASEYFAHGAWEQYQLPYTILRPFNCVGIGERRAVRDTDIMSGNVKLALSHVVPDLVLKALKGQDPLHILGDGQPGPPLHLRRRPGARDPARDGVAERPSTRTSTSRRRPPRRCWSWPRRSGPRSTADDSPFRYVSDPPFEHDVQLRVPDVRKARDVLGFEATTTLSQMLDEVIPWIEAELEAGRL